MKVLRNRLGASYGVGMSLIVSFYSFILQMKKQRCEFVRAGQRLCDGSKATRPAETRAWSQVPGATSGAPPPLQAAPLFSKTAKRGLNCLTPVPSLIQDEAQID